ncbi:multifunctional 2',3'-cyclic-nucleotide 2'-phosphodiesterase/5'-nucleotidase/3'-nucleotidase [Bacilli bacterium]|nr:multifunctional 2',3'-cyclic-nucleotide 2'-phosphodiesterase/5'-nucleotidase/3'-nucleotidase [Bacilli bacterium]GHU40003.1 multifunctional 2',3'-cyclic-nucleotide 2'-phosphodiesterase/5'-nucleotidase/3'-nucleotidase [Bacilli bacterium]
MTSQENVLKILHLNDLHSHFENYPKIKRFFSDKSAGCSDVLRFDIGDNVDRSHALSEATLGQANVELMNALDLTAATIGNNEGLGLPKEKLDRLYDHANFDIVLANLKDQGKQPSWAVEKKRVTTSFGMTIDIFGLTAPYPLAYPPMGWDILAPESVLAQQLRETDADFTILLSHLGWRFDEKAAVTFDNLDLILGAHTHHLYEYGKYINDTMLAAAGRYGEYVGEVTLRFDEDYQCIQSEMMAEDVRHLATVAGDKEWIQRQAEQGHELLRACQVARLAQPLTNHPPEYPATRFVAELMGDYYQVPAVILNSGMIVKEIPKKLTLDDLHDILPHSIRMVKLTVTGTELEAVLREVYDVGNYLKTQRIVGMGFRGKEFGDIMTVGLTYREAQVLYQGSPVVADQRYLVLVPDQYLFASYFPILKSSGRAEIQFPRFMREIVADALAHRDNL